jgi:type II restriction/modification system DNA methylase subunit YeeA
VFIIKPERDISRTTVGLYWQHERARDEMRNALKALPRFLATVRVSKHRIFRWFTAPTLADSSCFVFARDDDYFFGLLHSRLHEVWALKLGTRLETRPRYTPTTCFETFPFPEPNEKGRDEIAAAAKELNELRENWLTPPEWTLTRELIFSGSIDGPWSRFVHKPNKHGIGTVRYPRIEPRDEEAAKKLAKRTLTNLYNERPAWLANAHAKLDAAVAAAYGFTADLSDDAILEKLLALNLERSAIEKRSRPLKARGSRGKAEDELI